MATAELTTSRLEELLGDDAADLLQHESTTVPQSLLHLPGPDWVDRLFVDSDMSSGFVLPTASSIGAATISEPLATTICPQPPSWTRSRRCSCRWSSSSRH